MTFDANANVGPSVYDDFEFEPTFDALEAAHDEAGIDGGVVAPLKPPELDFAAANERLADDVADRPDYVGIARVDPRVDDAVAQAERAIDDLGLAGLKLHPWEESLSITSPMVEPVLDIAADRDVPVWIHAGYPGVSHALSVRSVAQDYPSVSFVLTHGAQLDISGLSLTDALLLAADTENTFFELSGVYRRDLIEDLVERIGADRVAFGTNAPYFHPVVETSRVTTAALDSAATSAVLGETIQSLVD